jgi:hypothetical protein
LIGGLEEGLSRLKLEVKGGKCEWRRVREMTSQVENQNTRSIN